MPTENGDRIVPGRLYRCTYPKGLEEWRRRGRGVGINSTEIVLLLEKTQVNVHRNTPPYFKFKVLVGDFVGTFTLAEDRFFAYFEELT